MGNLKKIAKELYFADVKNEDWRTKFLWSLKTKNVVDKRESGFYCFYCKQFSQKEVALPQKDKVIFENNEIWICHTNYDGCRGWD